MLPIHVPALSLALALAPTQNPTPPGTAVATVVPAPGRQAVHPASGISAAKLWDQAGGLLEASSTPTLGSLYPLSTKLYVDPVLDAVGIGTTTPSATLDVFGTVEFGSSNYAGAAFASVLGGAQNRVENAVASSIGGGTTNTIEAGSSLSFIGGGGDNLVQASQGAIGGGTRNSIVGFNGAIPGGEDNTAGNYSFAAGRAADASLPGCFVWADSSGVPFQSTVQDQFLVRAAGGVGIGTNTPGSQLDVAGVVRSSGPTGGGFTAANPNVPGASASLSWLDDIARIRVGGIGAGAQNGLDIQTIGNTSLLRITGSGNAIAKGQMHATSFVQTSDARLKTDVRELEDAMELVRGLHGVSFAWEPQRMPDARAGRQVGFLAQEVRGVLPEAVHENAEGSLGVSYTQVVPVLVEALKEQDRRIADLEQELAELRRLVTPR